MRYITVIVGSILSFCEYYRPSVALCCDYTVQFELPAICSSQCCDYTVQFELCFIWRSFLQEKNNGISSHHKQLGTQNDGLFVDCVCAECKHVCCFLSIKLGYLIENYVQRVWLSHKQLSATCRVLSPRIMCNM